VQHSFQQDDTDMCDSGFVPGTSRADSMVSPGLASLSSTLKLLLIIWIAFTTCTNIGRDFGLPTERVAVYDPIIYLPWLYIMVIATNFIQITSRIRFALAQVKDKHIDLKDKNAACLFSRTRHIKPFRRQNKKLMLLGSSICWFFLWSAFFGLGFNDLRVKAESRSTSIIVKSILFIDNLVQQHSNELYSSDIGWMLTASTLVFLMVPGVAFFYSGLRYRKSVSSLAWLACISTSLVFFQWFFSAYSISFTRITPASISDPHSLTTIFYILCQWFVNLGRDKFTISSRIEISRTKSLATSQLISAATNISGGLQLSANLNTHLMVSIAGLLIGMFLLDLLSSVSRRNPL